MDDVQIATVRKNSREHFRIAVGEFHGRRMVDLRVYELDARGNPAPTRKGVTIKPELLDELIAGLVNARTRAQRPPAPPHQPAGERAACAQLTPTRPTSA